MNLKLKLRQDMLRGSVDFFLFDKSKPTPAVALPLSMQTISRYEPADQPTFTLDHEEAKHFLTTVLDEAWELGIRPTGYKDDLGSVHGHLEDMRRIAFHKLGIK